MSAANVEVVRRFVDAFNRLDVESMDDYYDPEVELHEWPTAPGAQVYRGIDGVRSALDNWFDVWEWMRVEIVDLVDAGDQVLVTLDQRAKGRGSEIEVAIRSYNVYAFRDGRVFRMQLFTEREAALEAAGLTAEPIPGEENR
jgi:ketosteroid isomerase-like protein